MKAPINFVAGLGAGILLCVIAFGASSAILDGWDKGKWPLVRCHLAMAWSAYKASVPKGITMTRTGPVGPACEIIKRLGGDPQP